MFHFIWYILIGLISTTGGCFVLPRTSRRCRIWCAGACRWTPRANRTPIGAHELRCGLVCALCVSLVSGGLIFMYLQKATYLVGEHKTPDWKKAEAGGLQSMRDYWSRKMNVTDVTKLPDYKPAGVWERRWDDPTGQAGNRVWHRFDVSEADARAKLKRYTIVQNPDYGKGNLISMLQDALPNNRALLGTSERLRAGIINPDQRTAGASSAEDLNSGGADYAFARLRNSPTAPGIHWKPERLARRMDAIHYPGDRYGQTVGETVERERAKTLSQMVSYAENDSGNEFDVKHHLDLMTDLDHIQTSNSTVRARAIALFKANGIQKFPDGRTLEEVVR